MTDWCKEDPGLRARRKEQDGNIDSLQGEGDEQQKSWRQSRRRKCRAGTTATVFQKKVIIKLSGSEDSRQKMAKIRDGNVVFSRGHTATASEQSQLAAGRCNSDFKLLWLFCKHGWSVR
jgi:hypothetical protein